MQSTAATHSLRAPKRAGAWVLLSVGCLGLALSEIGLYLDMEPFPTWFFDFAWWSYILAADGLVYLRSGTSLLLNRTKSFALLALFGCAFWLLFELFNLRLENWYYVMLPSSQWVRFAGIALSFATVFPGIIETADLLRTTRFGRRSRTGPKFALHARALRMCTALGLAFALLPLLWPRTTFPLVWGCTALLIEPWLYRTGKPCFLRDLERGEWSHLLRVLAAGFVCGLLWEFWNFWSQAKWIYTVPFFDELKLFEMPVLGFLGFPPFALECVIFARFLVAKGWLPEYESEAVAAATPKGPPPHSANWALGTAMLFSMASIPLVDRYIVRSTVPRLAELTTDSALLAEHDLDAQLKASHWLTQLEVQRVESPGAHKMSPALKALEARAKLSLLAGMGARGTNWLQALGINSIEELAGAQLEQLLQHGSRATPESLRRDGPTEAQLRIWLRRAQASAASGS